MDFENKEAPVIVGEEYTLKIEALGAKGDGIAKVNGFAVIIPGAQIDDEVKVRVLKVLRKFAFAEIIAG